MLVEREKMLRVYGENPATWAERHRIIPFSAPCDTCGVELETTIPFATGPWRGLIAPYCACGNGYPPYCIIKTDDPMLNILFGGPR